MLDLHQPVGLERRAGGHEVDDTLAKAEARRQLHGAGELEALGLDAAPGEVTPGDLGIFGGDAHMGPARRVVARHHLGGLRHHHPAAADAEVEGRVDFRIVEFHEHVVAGDAELGAAEGDDGGDVEGAHANDVERRIGGGKLELARVRVVDSRFRLDAHAREQRPELFKDTAPGQGQHH